jgi:hypothetical protein
MLDLSIIFFSILKSTASHSPGFQLTLLKTTQIFRKEGFWLHVQKPNSLTRPSPPEGKQHGSTPEAHVLSRKARTMSCDPDRVYPKFPRTTGEEVKLFYVKNI